MRFFQIEPKYFPGEEGDSWTVRQQSKCPLCGLLSGPIRGRFQTPDDEVLSPSLYFDDDEAPPVFRIAGLYFVTGRVRDLVSAVIPEAHFMPTAVENREIDDIWWFVTSGRVKVVPLYWTIAEPCTHCGVKRQERVKNRPFVPRYQIVDGSWTGSGIYRAEETGSPDFVDEPLKSVLEAEAHSFTHPLLEFKAVEIEQAQPPDGGDGGPVPQP